MSLARKIVLLMVLASITLSAFALDIDTGKGTISVSDPGVKYGPSFGYDPKTKTKDMFKKLGERSTALTKALKDLRKKRSKAKGKEAKAKVTEEIKAVQKELKKVQKDHAYEKKLKSHANKPSTEPKRSQWKQKMREKYLKKMEKDQIKWLEKQKRRRNRAVSVLDLRDLGDVTLGDVSSANSDVMDAQRDLEDVEDQIEEAKCEEVNDENEEICLELGDARTEASATLEQVESRFGNLARSVPPILLGSGALYVIYDRMSELRESYREMRGVERELINCTENCDAIKEQAESLKDSIESQEAIDKTELDEAQDELKEDEIGGPVDAELIIPNYLSQNTEIPFGNKDELPLIFAIDTTEVEDVVKSAQARVNGELIELVYYPERGVFTGNYSGYKGKLDLVGTTEIELMDGQVLRKTFKGRINTEKPNVKITSTPGSMFKKGKFKIHVTGEFDKIEISGENVKSQTLKFETMKTSHKMTVKARKKGSATINVVATRTSKNVKMPEFEGEALATDEIGRVIRGDDLFQGINLGRGKKKELGFCCEDMNELTCEGCIAGKRTRKSCKALNKLPGYNFKAFLVAKSLTCTKL